MALALTIRNRQQARAVNVLLLRRITRALLLDLLQLPDADLGVIVVAAPEMIRLNETFLRHAGSTDVITFDYGFGVPPSGGSGSLGRRLPNPDRLKAELRTLHGEIFVCVDEAIIQARRFRTSWPAELVRYVVHGVLHLRGFDDHATADRRRMKSEENRLHRLLTGRFPLSRLARAR